MVEAKDTDIFLVSYPKSGTTWMQYIMYLCLDIKHPPDQTMRDVFPVMTPSSQPTATSGLIKTHMFASDLPPQCKKVYMQRNPLDVCVSLYHHLKRPDTQLDAFITQFEKGSIYYKTWKAHTTDAALTSNILIINYEDLTNNFDKILDRLEEFLDIKLTSAKRTEIYNKTTFTAMRENQAFLVPIVSKPNFFRKGQVDSYKDELTDKQIARIQSFVAA